MSETTYSSTLLDRDGLAMDWTGVRLRAIELIDSDWIGLGIVWTGAKTLSLAG